MTSRSYEGPALDATYQYITERPSLEQQADEVEYATDPEPGGQESVENVPVPTEETGPEVDGQATLADFAGWSA